MDRKGDRDDVIKRREMVGSEEADPFQLNDGAWRNLVVLSTTDHTPNVWMAVIRAKCCDVTPLRYVKARKDIWHEKTKGSMMKRDG